jgi:hypothetical protein
MNPQANNPEEVDIIQFFNAIGKMFKNMFAGIKNLFLSILHLFLNLLLYVKKYYLYFGAMILIGIILAFINSNKTEKMFAAEVTVQTNYGAQIALQDKLDFFNNLILDEKYDLLSKELGISANQAENILGFEMKPQINDVYLVENYNDYLSKMDSTMHNYIKFKDYKNAISTNEDLYNYWTVKVLGNTPTIFHHLNNKFEQILNDNQALKERKENYLFALNTDKKNTLKSLADIDSLRNVYNKVLLDNAKKQSGGSTNIVVSNDQIRGPEAAYDLFGKRADMLEQLEKVSQKLNRFNHIVQLKNSFPMYGEKDYGITDNLYVKYPIMGILLVFLILLLIDFNKYLNKYQKEKEAQS